MFNRIQTDGRVNIYYRNENKRKTERSAKVEARVARFFLAQHTETGKKYQKDHKIFSMITEFTK
jgi:hypothetical protein